MAFNKFERVLSGQDEAPERNNRYDRIVSNIGDNSKKRAQVNVYNAKDAEPSRSVEALRLSKEMNVPVDFVERNFDEVKRDKANGAVDFNKLAVSNPGTTKWLNKPINARVGRDQIEKMSEIETKVGRFKQPKSDPITIHKELGQAISGGWGDLKLSTVMTMAAKGMIDHDTAADMMVEFNNERVNREKNIPSFVSKFNEITSKELDDVTPEVDKFLGAVGELKKEITMSALKDMASGGGMAFAEFMDVMYESAKMPRALLYTNAQNLASTFPALAASVAGGIAGAQTGALAGGVIGTSVFPGVGTLGGIGVGATVGGFGGSIGGMIGGSAIIEHGFSMVEDIGKKNINMSDRDANMAMLRDVDYMKEINERANRKAIGTAALDGVFNLFAGGFLKKAGSGLRKKLAAGAKDVAVQAAGEAVSEGAGQTFKEGKITGEIVSQSAFEGLISIGQSVAETGTGVARQSFSEVRAEYSPKTEKAAEQVTEKTAKAVKALMDFETLAEVQEKVKEFDAEPSQVQELIDLSTGGDEGGSVYMQADDFDSYFKRKGKSPAEEAAKIMGDDGKAYRESKNNGNNIQVSVGKFISNTASNPELSDIIEIARTSVDGPTLTEAKEHMEALPGLMEGLANEALNEDEFRTEVETDAKKVGVQVKDQLVKAGETATNAAFYSTVYEATFNSLATRMGVKPSVLFEKYGLKVRGPEQVEQLKAGQSIFNQDDIKLEKTEAIDIANKALAGDLEVIGSGAETEVFDAGEFVVKKFKKKDHIVGLGGKKRFMIESVLEDMGFAPKVLRIDTKSGETLFLQKKEKTLAQYIQENVNSQSSSTIDKFLKQEGIIEQINEMDRQIRAVGISPLDMSKENLSFENGQVKIIDAGVFRLDITRSRKLINEELARLEKDKDSLDNLFSIVKKSLKDPDQLAAATARFDEKVSLYKEKKASLESVKPILGLSKDERSSLKEKIIVEGKDQKDFFQEGGRGRIRFGINRQFNIDLLRNADPSTFLHESGHFFLEVMGDMAEADGTPQQIKDDYQEILKWFDVESRDKIGTEQHEQWARGFEAYLMTGKAPSTKLRKAFQRFRQWLTSIYRNIRNLNVELTPEVKDIMNRMLATDNEISEVMTDNNMEPLFSDPSAFGFTGEKADKYIEAVENSRMLAEEDMSAKVMDGLVRKETKQWKDRRKAVRVEVEAEVNQHPIYRVMAMLRRGKNADGTDLPEGAAVFKLNRQDLVDQYGADFVKNLPRPSIYAREGGVHPDVVAGMYGFADGDEMVVAIANAPKRKEFIDQQTDKRMNEDFPDLLSSDEELENAALRAVHNDKRSQLLRLELEYLLSNDLAVGKGVIRKSTKRLPNDKFVKNQAKVIIGGKKVKDVRPHVFLLAERRAAKEAGELLTQGDLEGAYTAKERELLNHELYKEALAKKDLIKKSLQKQKRFWKKDEDLAKTRDINFIQAARAVLSEFGLGRGEKNAIQHLDSIKQYDPEGYETIKALVEDAIDGSDNYKEVTMEKYESMNEAIQGLWDLAKSAREIEVDGKRFEIETAKNEIIESLAKFTKEKPRSQYDETAGFWEDTKTAFLSVAAKLKRAEHWVSTMDLGDINGVFRKYLYREVADAEQKAIKLSRDIKKKILVEANKLGELSTDPIESRELGFKFRGKQELLGAIMHTGNPSSLKKLLVGRNWGSINEDKTLNTVRWDSFVKRMYAEGTLTKADMDFVQSVWDIMEDLKPMAQAAFKKVNGVYFDSITTHPVSTPFGTYRGGYMPAKIDPNPPKQGPQQAVVVANKQRVQQQIENIGLQSMPYSGGGGFGKRRVDNFNKPLLLDVNLAAKHIDEVIRFSLIKPAVIDATKLLMNPDLRKALDDFDIGIVEGVLMPALDRADKQRSSNIENGTGNKYIQKGANFLMQNSVMQIMFLNPQNIIEQLTGLFPAIYRTKSPRRMMTAFAQYLAAPKEMSKFISEKSVVMANRFEHSVLDYYDEMKGIFESPNNYIKTRDFAKKHALIGQLMLQNNMDVAVWMASYEKAIVDGFSDSDAVRTADRDVKETQSAITSFDRSDAESNPFLRFVNMFMGFFNNLKELNVQEFKKIYHSDMGMPQKSAAFMYAYWMNFASIAIGSALIKAALKGGIDEDDDGEYMDDAMEIVFGSQLRMLAPMVPIVGPAVAAGFSRGNDKHWDDRVTASPAWDAISQIAGIGSAGFNMITKDEVKKKDVRDLLSGTGIILGLPLGPISRPIGYLQDVKQRKAKPSGPIDFTRGLITGAPGRN